MSTLADRFGGKEVVWLAVNSTNYMDAAKDRAWRTEQGFSYPILDDSAGRSAEPTAPRRPRTCS